jgi:hypothetical protein
MKASTFANKIIKNLFKEDNMLNFEYIMLKELCLFANKKKTYTYYISNHRICIWGDFYKLDNVSSFFNKLGVKTELIDNDGSLMFKNFRISNNTFRNIKPFLDEIREYVKKKYKFEVTFSKYDGDVYGMSLSSNTITKERLLEAIKHIANNNK